MVPFIYAMLTPVVLNISIEYERGLPKISQDTQQSTQRKHACNWARTKLISGTPQTKYSSSFSLNVFNAAAGMTSWRLRGHISRDSPSKRIGTRRECCQKWTNPVLSADTCFSMPRDSRHSSMHSTNSCLLSSVTWRCAGPGEKENNKKITLTAFQQMKVTIERWHNEHQWMPRWA